MTLPKNIRGAIFDLDGTLLDSLGAWHDVDVRFFERRKLALPDDYFRAIKALDLSEAARYTKTRFGLPDREENMIGEWRELIREEYRLRVALKPFARELLVSLSAKKIRLAVATSSDPALFLPALTRGGVASLFSAITTTRDAGRNKESPHVYLEAARRLDLPPCDCAVFEDIEAGVRSAKAGGFYTVAVYDEHNAGEKARLRDEADLFIEDFSELLPM